MARSVSFAARQACHKRDGLPRVHLDPFLGKSFLRPEGQGEVHVVAADKEMVAHGDALEREVAVLGFHADEGKISRAAADVADQQDVAGGEGLRASGRCCQRAKRRARLGVLRAG